MTAFLLATAAPLAHAQQAPAKKAEKSEQPEKKGSQDPEVTYKMLNLFGDVFDRVRRDYVVPVSDEDLIKAALNGMLSSLDPHSSYMDAKDFQEMQVQTKGEFGGLGIEVTMDNGLVKVVSPIDDTPAAKAGIKSGDYISHIDDTPVMGMALQEAVDKMRGKIGSKIKLTVLREGVKTPLTFNLMRDRIKIESVASHPEKDIVYLRIRSFSESTNDSLEAAYNKEAKAIGNVKGVVLDLRNNPGGLLDQAVAVSDDFLNSGEIVSTRGRDPNNTVRFNAKDGVLVPDNIPIVILTNNGTASASEIVSGALQDHHRAIVMGTQTFGKGSVQTVIPMPGYGAMRLTTARYYTPSGRSIQAEGITPDIMVEQAKIEPIDEGKMMLEANLPHRLDKGDAATNADSKADTPKVSDDKKPIQDYQLSRALDLLRGLSVMKTANQ